MAGVGGEALAAAGLANVLGLFGDGFRGYVAAVVVGVDAGDWFLVELSEQDVGDGVMNGFGRMLKNVGEAHVKPALAQPDRRVERREAAETNVECWDGRARTKLAVLVLEDGYERDRR